MHAKVSTGIVMDFLTTIESGLSGSLGIAARDVRYLVAVSGGPDSVALITAACKLGLDVVLAHVNHGLRGAESDEDERFCAALAEKLDSRFTSVTLSQSKRDEASLREARYAALAAMAADANCKCILTAHTLDDQIETLLLRLFRGTSPKGMRGIPRVRELNEFVDLVRPMLQLRRTDVLAFLNEERQLYRLDSSNAANDYARNFLRNQVIPVITARFGDIAPHLENLRKLIHEDEYVLAELAEVRSASMFASSIGCPVASFLSEPMSLQRRVLAHELRLRGVELSSERIESLLTVIHSGGSYTLNSDWQFVVGEGHIAFRAKEDEPDENSPNTYEEELRMNGTTIALELNCAIQLKQAEGPVTEFPRATASEILVDLAEVPTPLVLRRRRSGDVIMPFGMDRHVRLKKYLQTHRKFDGRHAGYPAVVAHGNEVYWVPEVGISEKLRARGSPTHQLRFFHLSREEIQIS